MFIFIYRFIYRLLNWKRLRAPARPYFFRSFILGSRERSPAFFNRGRSSALYFTKARAIPRRRAPACPDTPPPDVVAKISNWSAVSDVSNGCLIRVRSDSAGKLLSSGAWLTRMVPLPGLRKTRAVEVLRRPVP